MEDHEVLDRLGRSQFGLVTLEQLQAAGYSMGRIRRMREAGRITTVRRGVFRLIGTAPSWRASALAAVLCAERTLKPGGGDMSVARVVLSHRSAGVLWELLDHSVERGPLEITSPEQQRVRGVVAHRRQLGPGQVTMRFGIPVTTVARTLFDLSSSIGKDQLPELVDESLRRRLVTLGEIAACADSCPAGRGNRLGPTQQILVDRTAQFSPGANVWELKMDRLWDKWGLPPAVRQFRVTVRGHHYVLDRAIVDLKIGVEWNGYEYHGLRSRFDQDSRRRTELAAAGWLMLDFTSNSPPALICQSVRSVVEQRRRLLGIAG